MLKYKTQFIVAGEVSHSTYTFPYGIEKAKHEDFYLEVIDKPFSGGNLLKVFLKDDDSLKTIEKAMDFIAKKASFSIFGTTVIVNPVLYACVISSYDQRTYNIEVHNQKIYVKETLDLV